MYSKNSTQNAMITNMARQFGRSINMAIIDDIFVSYSKPFNLQKTWKTRKGKTTMRRIGANYVVREWLEKEHSQFGKSNPSWWKFDNGINIADEKLWLILLLKFGE